MSDNGSKEDDIISSFWDHLGKANMTDEDMMIKTRRAVITIYLSKNGVLTESVGSH